MMCEYDITFTHSRSSKRLFQKKIHKIESCLHVYILTIFCKIVKLNCIQVGQIVLFVTVVTIELTFFFYVLPLVFAWSLR